MQTGNERKASSWDGTELDVSDPDRYQKRGDLCGVVKGNSKVIESSISFSDHWASLSVPLSRFPHPSQIISMGRIQSLKFRPELNKTSCCCALFIGSAPLLYAGRFDLKFLGSFIRWKEVELKRHELFQYYIKKQDKNMLRTGLRMPNATGSFLVCGFDLKQTYNTVVRTPLCLAVHMSVRRRSRQA